MITRRVDRFLAATTNDLFNNTDLRQAPGPGAVSIWAASDQNDGTINVRVGGVSYAQANVIPNTAPRSTEVASLRSPISRRSSLSSSRREITLSVWRKTRSVRRQTSAADRLRPSSR